MPLKSDVCGCAPTNDSQSENGRFSHLSPRDPMLNPRLNPLLPASFAFIHSAAAHYTPHYHMVWAHSARCSSRCCQGTGNRLRVSRSGKSLTLALQSHSLRLSGSYFRWPPAEQRERERDESFWSAALLISPHRNLARYQPPPPPLLIEASQECLRWRAHPFLAPRGMDC